ncbi:ATP-binding protein [Candidatus Woesearchaeota archaeon]|nr:ATP-binding protein [Candidatus Woesearchaeota archaeon]
MDKNILRQILSDHQNQFRREENIVERELNTHYIFKGNEIIIISGIRRCGKSTFLRLLAKKVEGIKIFIDFDDVRFVDFDHHNFQDIQELIAEIYGVSQKKYYFLDEVQNIQYWEKWVNNLYAQGNKVFVTGSNATLLSSEISTFLTGRNKVVKLFPFSFKEFLKLKDYQNLDVTKLTTEEKGKIYALFLEYFVMGGFPLIIKNNDLELSKQYFDDILNKDVINRYKIREVKELKDLILFLFSHVSSQYSYSTLKQVTGIKSLSTIKNYIDYFQNVFLLSSVQRFDYSIKKQKVSSSKIYALDNSFLKTVAFNFTENLGRRLENLIFIELKRRDKEIYYHTEKKECDIVIRDGLKIVQAIQVAVHLATPETKKRELEGLLDAMIKYKLSEGLLLTLETEEIIIKGDRKIIVKPIWKWLLENETVKS